MRLLDDDTYLDTSPSHSIGEIKLVIARISKSQKKAKPDTYFHTAPLHSQKVHERSKKGVTHRVR